uniref:Uncharacterized protein n=1 Tax=Euplotes crassus TaxID=5936 RepID=A0A7S3KDM4_EUPCR
MQERRERQRLAKLRQQENAEQYTRREIPTPEPISGRQNLDVQTDQFVEELTDKAPCYDIGSQTEFKLEQRVLDFSIPEKNGEDFCGQTEDGDLFIFDDDVEPILQVLCGKTLEHAKMEVLEEEELKYMREEQKHFQKLREDEIAEAQKLEAIELRKKQEIERRKQQHKVKKLEKIAAHKKFTCRQLAKKFFAPLTSHAIVSLKERGAMIDSFNSQLQENVVPWLYEKVNEFMIDDELHEANNDKVLIDFMSIEMQGHRSMIEKEHKRLEDERILAEEAEKQRLNEKEQRRLERERRRKEEELRKLKEDIKERFVTSGEPVEGIVAQELSTPCADLISKSIIGAIGGPFAQIALVLSVLKDTQSEDEYEEFYSKKNVAQFLIFYAISHMKSEQFTVLMGKHIEAFMQETDQTMDDITKLTGPKAKAFRELMKDRTNGMLNAEFRYLFSIAEEIGINQEVFGMIHDVLADIITRKPKAKGGSETKQDQFLKKIKVATVPEEGTEDLDNCKAIVRIKIPMVEKKEEGSDEDSDDKSEDQEEGEDKKKEPVMVESPIEDKVHLINPKGTDYNIMVLHQAGSRVFRKDILSSLKKIMPTFEDIEVDNVSKEVDELVQKLEEKWISRFEYPVFDFELN